MATLKLPYGPEVPLTLPSPEALATAAGNVFERLTNGHLADLTPLPSEVLHTAPQCTVSRYDAVIRRDDENPTILLVPPLAAPATCFDLRRGCSMAEHFVTRGHRTYLVDYGTIAYSDRRLGLEHWVDKVIPDAVDVAARDSGKPIHIVAWCLGGIMSLLAQASRHDLPIASITAIAKPVRRQPGAADRPDPADRDSHRWPARHPGLHRARPARQRHSFAGRSSFPASTSTSPSRWRS